MSLPPARELRWGKLAARWLMHSEAVASMTRSASRVLLEGAAPRPGERWLDLASGAGDPGVALAAAVGAGGRVLASDGVAEMVFGCMERTQGLAGVVQRAEQLGLAPAAFDGVSCRFGAMFFDDLAGALAEALRVLRPEGRLAWLVWGAPERNLYFTGAMGALDAAGAVELPPEPGARTVFELATPGELAEAARAAGFEGVSERREVCAMEVPCAPDELLELQGRLSDRVEARLEGLAEPARRAAAERLAEQVAPHATAQGLALPAEVILVCGQRPG